MEESNMDTESDVETVDGGDEEEYRVDGGIEHGGEGDDEFDALEDEEEVAGLDEVTERINYLISHSRFDVDDGALEGEGGVQEDEEIGDIMKSEQRRYKIIIY